MLMFLKPYNLDVYCACEYNAISRNRKGSQFRGDLVSSKTSLQLASWSPLASTLTSSSFTPLELCSLFDSTIRVHFQDSTEFLQSLYSRVVGQVYSIKYKLFCLKNIKTPMWFYDFGASRSLQRNTIQ